MASYTPEAAPRQPTAPPPPHPDAEERLNALERQLAMAEQRRQTQVEVELHTLREQVLTLGRETRQQQQALLASVRELIDELRKEVAEALHHLSQDAERVGQHAEAQTNRVVERLRHELLETMVQRPTSTDPRQVLGELLVTLGRQLQDVDRGAGA